MDDDEAPQLLKEMHEHLDVRAWFDVCIGQEWEAVWYVHGRAHPWTVQSRLTRLIHHNFTIHRYDQMCAANRTSKQASKRSSSEDRRRWRVWTKWGVCIRSGSQQSSDQSNDFIIIAGPGRQRRRAATSELGQGTFFFSVHGCVWLCVCACVDPGSLCCPLEELSASCVLWLPSSPQERGGGGPKKTTKDDEGMGRTGREDD